MASSGPNGALVVWLKVDPSVNPDEWSFSCTSTVSRGTSSCL